MRAVEQVQQIQSRIAELVGPQRFRVWFKDATHFTVADGFLKVGVPNLFIGGWLENHFSDAINQAANEVTGRNLDVAFVIDSSLARQLRPRQPDNQLEYASSNPQRLAKEQGRLGTPPAMTPLKGRLEEFVVGSSNRLAYSTAMSVAESPASQFNPLFLHGGCGLGKTHLLQGVCNVIRERHPSLRWLYASGEDFTNHFVYSVKNNERDAFRQYYRNVDILVIDDIHFFANKRATQEEFLHTFNAIDAAGKQVILASDAHPKMIGHLSDSLVNRFISGMVVRIDPPDPELRAAVLTRRAERMGVDIPSDVIDFVAQNYQVNIRELEGALLKLVAYAKVENHAINLATARAALRDHMVTAPPVAKLTDIENLVAIYFGLTPADLHTSRKTRTIALARSVAMHLARRYTDMSFPEIGRFMGNKNHTTVLIACRRIAQTLARDGMVKWLTPTGIKEARLTGILREMEDQIGRHITPKR